METPQINAKDVKKRRQYKQKIFRTAVKQVLNGERSLRNASMKFDVPYTTLSRRVKAIKNSKFS